MNNKEKTRDFEADYYEELHRRFKLEEENELKSTYLTKYSKRNL